MKVKSVAVTILVAMSIAVNWATIRRKDDPVLKTQTDPISFQQKAEEEKDGKKGAPTPSFKFYEKGQFLAEPPVTADPGLKNKPRPEKIPQVGEPIPENLDRGTQGQELSEDEGWFEEEGKGTGAPGKG